MHSNRCRVAQFDSCSLSNIQEQQQQQQRIPRRVILQKGSSGLGFNIVGDESGGGIFVSFLLAGAAADLSGEIRRGDQLLFVNGHNLEHASHSQAVAVLKQSGKFVEIICQYQPQAYYNFEARRQVLYEHLMELQQYTGTLKTTQKRTFYIRALFDYDPSRDSGLPSRGVGFKHGDILEVTNASDDEWWQARKLSGDILDDDLGIIPGKKRVERKERLRLKNVKFVGKESESSGVLVSDKKKKLLFSRKFFFTKAKDRSRSDGSILASEQSHSVTEKASSEESSILCYEAVVRQELKYVRPIVILGPLKERFMEDLVAEFPEKFAICVPNTTRPKADHELDGREYHFVSREQMERDIQEHSFVEVGQFNDHFYGTSVRAIREIAEAEKHCLLDVSADAAKKLESFGFYPVVILIKPKCVDSIMEWMKRVSADQARTMFEQTLKLERDFHQHFTVILNGDAVDDLFVKLKDAVESHSAPVAWLPSKEKL